MNAVVPALLLAAATANANPRALPFTYTTDSLAPGSVELEQYADLVALRGRDPASIDHRSYLGTAFQTEIEIGLCDRLELGLYFAFAPSAGESIADQVAVPGSTTGLKQRLKYLLADPGAWPIDVGLYGELVESSTELELEAKVLLGKRFGKLRVAANLTAEMELYFDKQRDLVLDPSAGATYEVTPKIHLGLDSRLRGEYPQHPKPATRTFGLGPALYVGPAAMFNFGKVWWALGAYGRVTDVSHDLQPGEPFGRFWLRTVVGYDL